MKGGKREGSGRKKKFGDVPTTKILIMVPTDKIAEFKKWCYDVLEGYKNNI